LVIIAEPQTSFTGVDEKSTKTVTAASTVLLNPFEDSVITVTADNGKEFSCHKKITESLKCDLYFADFYCL
jgi:IS30 family transposase